MDMTQPTPNPATTTTAHVLAVDDDPSVRQMIADYLSDNEVRVTTLASGREIAEVMARETIDLLVLDLRLPGEDGMQIARKLRPRHGLRDLVDDGVEIARFAVHHQSPSTYPIDASRCFTFRRASNTRDFSVPTGTCNIAEISS